MKTHLLARIGTLIAFVVALPAASNAASLLLDFGPTTTAAAVSIMGRKRTAPASITAWSKGMPSLKRSSMKSTRIIEFRTTIPAPAIKPIIEVAVKNAFSSPCAGMIPTSENGIAAIMINGVRNDWNQPTTRP